MDDGLLKTDAAVGSANTRPLQRRLPRKAFELQLEQAPQVGDAFLRIGPGRGDPPAQRRRVDEEDVPGDEVRLFPRADLAVPLRFADEMLDAVDLSGLFD